ncbi:PAS domain-containing protein [Streptomyces sp. PSAA01]|nr:PAS domain-containing protein [Streptomyces sp. PSAA01]MCG0284382.1 PAS domain-containing protein [Streptomyces sp. PSAA01]
MMRHDSGSAREWGGVDETDTARVTVSEDGTLTSWNDGARRLLGYPPPRVVGRPAAELLADPARAADAGARRARDRLTRWHGTVALRHQDGHEMPVRLLAHRTGPEDDWLLVAAAPRAELPPESWNDALMLWAYTQSPCPMAIYDADLRLRKVNSEMARVIGLPEAEIRDLRPSEIGGKLQGERLEGVMRHVLTTGEPREVETHLRTGGESKEHAWSAAFSPLKAKDGQVYAVCMAAHDITEQYLAHQRLLLLSAAGERIGSSLDIDHTAQEFADVCVPRLADYATNAIRHAVPPIRLRLIHDHSLICEVTDSSSTAPHMRRARTFDEGGRGLLLVARLSQRWGSRQTAEGKTIWSEQTLPVGLPAGLPGLD